MEYKYTDVERIKNLIAMVDKKQNMLSGKMKKIENTFPKSMDPVTAHLAGYDIANYPELESNWFILESRKDRLGKKLSEYDSWINEQDEIAELQRQEDIQEDFSYFRSVYAADCGFDATTSEREKYDAYKQWVRNQKGSSD